jgi:hypothetical protein
MRILTALGLVMLIGVAESVSAAAPVDADNLVQASAMVLAEATLIDAEMDECMRSDPGQSFRWQLADFIWQGENKQVMLVAQKVRQSEGESKLESNVESVLLNDAIGAFVVNVKLNPGACGLSANDISLGKKNVKTGTPRAYAFLTSAPPSSPQDVLEQEKADTTVGCMKGVANAGFRDFDRGVTSCLCSTKVMYTELTAAQRETLFQGNSGDLTTLPWAQPVIKKITECARLMRS